MLDILKGVGVLFVIATHLAWSDEERLAFGFPFWLDMAVPVFMLISGWVHALHFNRRGIATLDEAYGFSYIAKFFVRYTVPFVPVYLLEIIQYCVVKAADGKHISLKVIVWRFFRGGWGAGSYYYPYMVQFLFLFPLIYVIVRKYRERGLLYCMVANVMYELLKEAYFIREHTYRLLVFRYIFVIACGCYFYFHRERFDRRLWILTAFGGLYIFAISYLGVSPGIFHYWKKTSMLSCCFIIPVFGYLVIRWKRARCRPLELLGQASYNIFLVQMVYYRLLEEVVAEYVGSRLLLLGINLAFGISVGLIYYKLESPVTKRLWEAVKRRHEAGGKRAGIAGPGDA